MNIVLASSSPRRRELMEMLGLDNLKILPARGEEVPPEHASGPELVKALALAKAREVAALCAPEDLVIGADTIVWVDDHPFGKPHNEEEAARMLRRLSGETHTVMTGVSLYLGSQTTVFTTETQVTFYPLTDAEIETYLDTGEPFDKAGAYGIQGYGSLLVEEIHGDYFNVVGLPISKLNKLLINQ